MKKQSAVFLIPVAALAGYMAGAWGLREDKRSSADAAETRRLERRAKDARGFDTFARMVNLPETARHPPGHGAKIRKNVKPKPAIAVAKTNTPARADAPAAASATNAPPHRVAPEDLRARIAQAQDLWSARVDLARAQWKTRLKLDDAGMKAFDAALQEMNEKLYDSVATLAGLLAKEEKLTPELGMRLVGDTTAIMAETYDRIGAGLPEASRADVSDIQMFDFIDPGVAEPLVEVQDKIGRFPFHGGGARGAGGQ